MLFTTKIRSRDPRKRAPSPHNHQQRLAHVTACRRGWAGKGCCAEREADSCCSGAGGGGRGVAGASSHPPNQACPWWERDLLAPEIQRGPRMCCQTSPPNRGCNLHNNCSNLSGRVHIGLYPHALPLPLRSGRACSAWAWVGGAGSAPTGRFVCLRDGTSAPTGRCTTCTTCVETHPTLSGRGGAPWARRMPAPPVGWVPTRPNPFPQHAFFNMKRRIPCVQRLRRVRGRT